MTAAKEVSTSDWIASLRSQLSQNAGKVAIAVSGGGDSMALLDLARRAIQSTDVQVYAVTVDHGLRPEARDEAELVERFCADHAIPHTVLVWDGGSATGNVQGAARDARYSLIAEWARQNSIDAVALGHTQDDQAETFLMRLGRASGVEGLSEMDRRFRRHQVTWLRPVLDIRRSQLREYLSSNGIAWADDASNENVAFLRVQARSALAVLEELGIGTCQIARSSSHLAAANRAVNEFAKRIAEQAISIHGGDVLLPLGILDEPSEVRRRLLNKAITWVGRDAYSPRSAALEAVEKGIEEGRRQTLGGCLISVDRTHIRVSRELAALAGSQTATDEIWDGRWGAEGGHGGDLTLKHLGDGIHECPNWRETGFPRNTIMASPAIWSHETLIAAPLAGLTNGWRLESPTLEDFLSHAFTH